MPLTSASAQDWQRAIEGLRAIHADTDVLAYTGPSWRISQICEELEKGLASYELATRMGIDLASLPLKQPSKRFGVRSRRL
jgi:hypothetical protein